MASPGAPVDTEPEILPPREPAPPRAIVVTPRPPAGVGPRRARARVVRRRRRLAVLFLVVVAAGGLVSMDVGGVRKGLEALVPSAPGDPAPPPSSLLLVWPTADDGGATIVLLGVPGATRGSALLVPSGTQVEVPSFGSRTLGAAFREGGAGTLVLAVENALGVDVGEVVALDAATLAALWSPVAPLDVRLRDRIDVGGRSYPTSGVQLSAEDAAQLATTRSSEGSDLDHLVVVHALLEGWFARLDQGTTEAGLVDRAGLDEAVAARAAHVIDALSSRHVTYDTLNVESLGVPGEERYRLADDVAEEVAGLFPGLVFTTEERIRVEILNGTGEAGLASEAARRLVPAGAEVVLTGNADQFGVEDTLVVLHRAELEPAARRLVDVLGVGKIRMAQKPLGVADATVVIGADFDLGGG